LKRGERAYNRQPFLGFCESIRKNVQHVADNEGMPFMRLKKNVTARAKGYPAGRTWFTAAGMM
jgi:hypothetical protein